MCFLGTMAYWLCWQDLLFHTPAFLYIHKRDFEVIWSLNKGSIVMELSVGSSLTLMSSGAYGVLLWPTGSPCMSPEGNDVVTWWF